MLKKILILLIFVFNIKPIFSQDDNLNFKIKSAYNSQKILGLHNNLRSSDKGVISANFNYNKSKISTLLALNLSGKNKLSFDESFLNYKSGIMNIGVGAINRHWSFSNESSLILSSNARPIKSIYLILGDVPKNYIQPRKTKWSLEFFNGMSSGSLNNQKSMLTGLRTTLSPSDNFDLELFQVNQWGNNNNNYFDLSSKFFNDSNNSLPNSTNKMAGAGLSYSTKNNNFPLKIYTQIIGEDEAGSLPSCLAYMLGMKWAYKKAKYPTTISIENIDTRTKKSTNNFCGPNSMYNNSVYSYTNDGNVMGSSIDTESTSLGFFGTTQFNKNFSLNYSIKFLTINDKNWIGHRLSTKRVSDTINTIGIAWTKNNFKLDGFIINQNLYLDTANINTKNIIGVSSTIIF